MARSTVVRYQLRLIACHVAAALAAAGAMPQLLAWGLEMRNVVLASILGAVLFLVLALAAGFTWRRSIPVHPARWAMTAPVGVALAVYLLLSVLGGFDPEDARLALEASLVSGVCALFSSVLFVLWTSASPAAALPGRQEDAE